MRALASGEKGFEKYPQFLARNFVFLNVYCRSVAEEHDPRGPEGPYRFKDRSVPVVVIQKWNGDDIRQQLGFATNPTGLNQLKVWVDAASKTNGPVVPPKHVARLMKRFKKGEKLLGKNFPGKAYKEFAKVAEGGKNQKKFPDGPPSVVARAESQMAAIVASGKQAIEEATVEDDSTATLAALKKLLRRYKEVPEIKVELDRRIAEQQ